MLEYHTPGAPHVWSRTPGQKINNVSVSCSCSPPDAVALTVSGIQPTNCGVHKHGGCIIGIVMTFPLLATAVRRSGEPCCQASHHRRHELTERQLANEPRQTRSSHAYQMSHVSFGSSSPPMLLHGAISRHVAKCGAWSNTSLSCHEKSMRRLPLVGSAGCYCLL